MGQFECQLSFWRVDILKMKPRSFQLIAGYLLEKDFFITLNKLAHVDVPIFLAVFELEIIFYRFSLAVRKISFFMAKKWIYRQIFNLDLADNLWRAVCIFDNQMFCSHGWLCWNYFQEIQQYFPAVPFSRNSPSWLNKAPSCQPIFGIKSSWQLLKFWYFRKKSQSQLPCWMPASQAQLFEKTKQLTREFWACSRDSNKRASEVHFPLVSTCSKFLK